MSLTIKERLTLWKLRRKIRKGTHWLDATQEHVDDLRRKGKVY